MIKVSFFSRVNNLLKFLWEFLRNHRPLFFLCISLTILSSIFFGGTLSLLLPVISQFISEGQSLSGESADFFGRIVNLYHVLVQNTEYKELYAIGIYSFVTIISDFIDYLVTYFNTGLTARITYDCRWRVYNTIQQMKYSEILKHPKGDFIQLMVTETRNVYAVFKQFENFIITAFKSFMIIFMLVLLSWKLCLILSIWFLLIILLNLKITKYIKKLSKVGLDLRFNFTNIITEGIFGLKQLRMFQAESYMESKINSASKSQVNNDTTLARINAIMPVLSNTFMILGIILIFVIWYYFSVFSDSIPRIAGLVTFLLYVNKLSPQISALSKEYGSIFSNLPGVKKVYEFLIKDSPKEEGGDYSSEHFLKDAIIFKKIFFQYVDNAPVLKGINLKIKKGSYIGIKGASGDGKTTMFNLFPRMFDPVKGNILIDGKNIKDYRLSFLRKKIGVVTQDFFLFNTNIKENLLMVKPDASDEEIWDALEKVDLKRFVESLERGLKSPVGNNGDRLSGGQRQRLSLASIFLGNHEIIIVDEGTSSVDKKTEAIILKSLKALNKEGKTIICSSHKDTTLVDVDKIYELSNGKLKAI